VAYDQLILIPGGGAEGTGAREVLDLFQHPEAHGVRADDPRWRGWTTSGVSVAEPRVDPVTEATVGYDVKSGERKAIDALLDDTQIPAIERNVVVQSTGQAKRRKGWSKLSKGYRQRLGRRGIKREQWEAGFDLRAARGHAPRPPRGAADLTLTMRAVTRPEALSGAERTALSRLVRPGWIPEGLSDEVVAALSQLRGTPSRWSAARFVPAPAGEPWAMIVSFR